MEDTEKQDIIRQMIECPICAKLLALSMEQPLRCPGIDYDSNGKLSHKSRYWYDLVEKNKLERKRIHDLYRETHKEHIDQHLKEIFGK